MSKTLVVDLVTPNSAVYEEKGKRVIINVKRGEVKLLEKYKPVNDIREIEFHDSVIAKIRVCLDGITTTEPVVSSKSPAAPKPAPGPITEKTAPKKIETVKEVEKKVTVIGNDVPGIVMEKLRALDIKAVLRRNFVKCDEFAEVIHMAIHAGDNAIIYGDGGYGKSDMMRYLLKEAGVYDDVFISSFGEDSTESQLWGEVNYKMLAAGEGFVYRTEDSFINKEFAVMEELLDAPVNTLLALKDCLEAKELRKGVQRVEMKTQCIIAFTNKSPQEVEEMGEYARALMSRFRIEYQHGWRTHEYDDYKELLTKRFPSGDSKTIDLASQVFEILSRRKNVSPRIAIAGCKFMLLENTKDAKAKIRPLRRITELARRSSELDSILEKIDSMEGMRKVVEIYERAKSDFEKEKNGDIRKALKILSNAETHIHAIPLNDEDYGRASNYRDSLKKMRDNLVKEL